MMGQIAELHWLLHQAFNFSNYRLNPWCLPVFIISLANMALFLKVPRREGINAVSIAFMTVGAATGIWLFSFSLMYCSATEGAALFWAKVSYIGVPWIPAALYFFTISSLQIYKQNRWTVRFGWALSALFSFAALFANQYIKGVRLYWWGYYPLYGWIGVISLFYIVAYTGMSFLQFLSRYRKSAPGSTQQLRTKSLLVAYGVSYLTFVDYLAKFGISAYPAGYLAVFVSLTLIIRAMERYHLVDITPQFAANSIIETIGDALFVLDPEGAIRFANRSTADLFGYSCEELKGKDIRTAMRVEGLPQEVLDMREDIRNCELSYPGPGGLARVLSLSASLMKGDAGQPLAVVCIVRDITKDKAAENELKRAREELEIRVEERTADLKAANLKLEEEISQKKRMENELLRMQKLESIGVLAGGIAHDFNNILTGIMGNLSLLRFHIFPGDKAYKMLEGAEKASLRARDLTQRLLTFAKGGEPVKKLSLLTDLIKESCEFSLSGSKTECHYFFDPELWPVEVDEGQISQVINNLALNAIQSMPEGGNIEVDCRNFEIAKDGYLPLLPGQYIRISIKDSGMGISPEQLAKIFDPFFTTKERGSGLGLTTSYSIIKKHGGHITADSATGAGTTFNVYLPACIGCDKKESAPKKEEIVFGHGRILLMDDDPGVRGVCEAMLSVLGYETISANDGGEAVEIFRQTIGNGGRFDAVILDLTVPGGMGGLEAVKLMSAADPEVKALVSSGYSKDPVMSDFKSYGFQGVISKPFKAAELGAALHKILNGREGK